MERKKKIILASLIFLIIIGNIAIYEKYNNKGTAKDTGATGNIVADPGIHLNPDRVEIQKNDLKSCCTFEKDGGTQHCYVLKRFDCSYCTTYCTPVQ